MEDIMQKPICPLCRGDLEMGHTTDVGRSRLHIWVEGALDASLRGIKRKGRRLYHLDALRCTRCGYVARIASRRWAPAQFAE